MNLEVELIAGVIKGGLPPAHLPAPRLVKIFIAGERDGKSSESRDFRESRGTDVFSFNERDVCRTFAIRSIELIQRIARISRYIPRNEQNSTSVTSRAREATTRRRRAIARR